MKAPLEQRQATLETAFAHLERQLDQLNEVVIDQGRTIARLEVRIKRLAQAVETQELDRVAAPNTKPPHYQP